MSRPKPAPSRARRRKIQLPYPNTYESIWEYREAFLSGQIDFVSFLGSDCPICGKQGCYREITPYWRYAIDLFPEFKKERIPVARFLCDKRQSTFSLLPTQLIPYHQYTVNAVIGALLLLLECSQRGQKGFYGASVAVHPDSLVTPWLVAYWLAVVVLGLRRAHGMLRQWYPLADIRSSHRSAACQEVAAYFLSLGWHLRVRWGPLLHGLSNRYSRRTGQFLFGTPSQSRVHHNRPVHR
ncbi:MAG: hypothetical protein HGA84_01285 [Syntrophobacteraceae bacterium]|nr:hypothetical protein [Syntrophobacteraceae bacterium]